MQDRLALNFGVIYHVKGDDVTIMQLYDAFTML